VLTAAPKNVLIPNFPRTLPHPGRGIFTGRSTGAILAAALTLPLGACSFQSHTVRESVSESLTFTSTGEFRSLIVDNNVGDIEIVADENATGITAEIVKIGRGSSRSNAQESLERIDVVFAPLADEDGVFVCTSEFPKKWAGHSYSLDWHITAPASLAIEILNNVGDIRAVGFADGVTARADVGDITLRDIAGGLDIRCNVGDIVADAAGPITITSDVGDIDLKVLTDASDTTSTVTVRCDVGDISVLLPAGFMGLVDASVDVGDVDADFEHVGSHAIVKQSRRHRSLRAELNHASSPVHELNADVGDVEITFYDPKSSD